MNKIVFLIITVLFIGVLGGYLLRQIQDVDPSVALRVVTPPQANQNNCLADECLMEDVEYPISELPADVKESLNKALLDEYKAYATYKTTIDTFGNVRPFIMIARAEQQHIASLQGLFEKYGMEIPENNLLDTIPVPTSIQEACGVGVQAEIVNIRLYKESLLPTVKGYEDITIVYTNLMNASEQKHLPAFQRCN